MLPRHKLRTYYPLAMAEGEGVGTAFEYAAKREALRKWGVAQPAGRLLIAGLPEIYGSSLDYFSLGAELGLPVIVVDDRPELLSKAVQALDRTRQEGQLPDLQANFLQVDDISHLNTLQGSFGWCICNEVLQRLDAAEQQRYVRELSRLAPLVTLFAPNGDNAAHTNLSGLDGLTLAAMGRLLELLDGKRTASGYCDMPPFPPGTTRSAAQRERAGSGRFEAFAMWGLGLFAQLEKWFPSRLQQKQAHIVFGFIERH